MIALDATLEDLICRHAETLKCAAIIHASGEVTNRVGDFTDFDQSGLASAVLGPHGDPAAAFQLAAQYENERKMLPQGMGQGKLFALLDKPRTEFVVVVFGHKNQDFYEHLRHRKEIASTMLQLFASYRP